METVQRGYNKIAGFAIVMALLFYSGAFVFFRCDVDNARCLLQTFYALATCCLVLYAVYGLYRSHQLWQSVFSFILVWVAYTVVLYCIWIDPAYYENHWKFINGLVIFAILFAPTSLLTIKFLQKK